MWAASKVTKLIGRRHAFGGGEVDGVAQPDGLGARERGCPVEAALVDGHDVEVIPHEPDGVFEVEAQDRLVRQPIDGRQRLGQAPSPTPTTPGRPRAHRV